MCLSLGCERIRCRKGRCCRNSCITTNNQPATSWFDDCKGEERKLQGCKICSVAWVAWDFSDVNCNTPGDASAIQHLVTRIPHVVSVLLTRPAGSTYPCVQVGLSVGSVPCACHFRVNGPNWLWILLFSVAGMYHPLPLDGNRRWRQNLIFWRETATHRDAENRCPCVVVCGWL